MTTLTYPHPDGTRHEVPDEMVDAFRHRLGCPGTRKANLVDTSMAWPNYRRSEQTEDQPAVEAYTAQRPAQPQRGDPGATVLTLRCTMCGADQHTVLDGPAEPPSQHGAAWKEQTMRATRTPKKKKES